MIEKEEGGRMADIFNLIRGSSNMERNRKKQEEPREPDKSHLDLDNFIIGADEKRQPSKHKRKQSDDLFDEEIEIGNEKTNKDYKKDIDVLNLIELDKLPDKKQNRTLKTEYLKLLDKVEELAKMNESIESSSTDYSIKIQRLKKETTQLKELVRYIASLLPDGANLKRVLETESWSVPTIEEELSEKLTTIIHRAREAEDYIEAQLGKAKEESKHHKRKIMALESKLSENEQKHKQKLLDLKEHYEKQLRERKFQKPQVDPAIQREKDEIAKMEAEIERRKQQLLGQAKHDETPSEEAVEEIAEDVADEEEVQDREEDDVAFEEFDLSDEEESEEEMLEEVEETKEEEVEVETHLLLDMERHLETMADDRKYLIEVIGATGISRNQELKTYLIEDQKGKDFYERNGNFSYADMSADTKGLRDSGYLTSERVELGAKNGYNFKVFELTDTGKAIYTILTKKHPAKPHKELIRDQHKTFEHGYLIVESASSFEAMGYKVYTKREDLRVDLSGGRRKDFDLIIEKEGKKQYIEVERGTHTDEGFFEAMNKIYEVMTKLYKGQPAEFYFIGPNQDKLFGSTKRQFFLWINKELGGVKSAKGKIIVNFATFGTIKELSKNKTNVQKEVWDTIRF